MKTLITLALCVAITGAAFAQSKPPPGFPPSVPAPPGMTHQIAGGVALLILGAAGIGVVIYAFWTPGPRWQTLVLLERSHLTGDERAIATNTVWQSGKQMPYAFTILCTNEFCSYRTKTIASGN